MMQAPNSAVRIGGAALALTLGGCEGLQSVLSPAGPEAERIVRLFWVLTVGSGVILAGVVALTALAMIGGAGARPWLAREAVVIGGGIIFPIVTLTGVLGYGLYVTQAGGTVAQGREEPIRITVVGERWWWRVIYRDASGHRFETANELRIPINRPVELALLSHDVIHSFWVPKLAGKVDMIPGRTNILRLTAREVGLSRGQCAEFCGGAHALMAFYVLAVTEPEYEAWLARAAGPAEPPQQPLTEQGQMLFMTSGCGACHSIRGTPATGVIGPDLTDVGGRVSLAAGILPNTRQTIAAWIVSNQHIKPDNLMPPFQIFSEPELHALAAYLESLK